MYQRNGTLVYRKFRGFFLPAVVLSMALGISVIVDAMIVGNVLGTREMAAVNLATPLTMCVNFFCTLFAIGGSTCVSIAKGKRENQKANELFTISILAFIIIGIIMMLLGVTFMDAIAHFLTQGGPLMGLVKDYTIVLAAGTPLLIIVMGSIYFIQTDGMPQLAAIIIVVSNVINLSFDFIFMKVFDMGIKGASFATITGYACGSGILLVYWFSKNRTLTFVKIKSPVVHIKTIVEYGSTASLGQGLLFVKNILINSIVLATIGEAGMVAYSVCISSLALVSMFIGGGAQSMVPLLGTFLGERDVAGIRYTAKKAFQVVGGLTIVCIAGMEVFPAQVFSFFGVKQEADLAIGIPALQIFAISTLGVAFSFMMMYYMQTIGQKKIAIGITLCEGLVVVVPCAYVFSHVFGAVGIWSSFVIAEVVTALYIVYQIKKAEKKARGKVKGLFLLEQTDNQGVLLDITVGGTIKDAAALSEQVETFAKKQKLPHNIAYQMGLLIEEAVANIITYNGGKQLTAIDVIVRVHNELITINIRDDGKPFDALYYAAKEETEFECSNIKVMQKIASRIEYARVIGLNTVTLELATLV